ncbi:MAG: hypothetical protein IKZ61_02490 [Prevotella sp.]|nr:hypothetical protein [Prevotella sp.]
MNNTKKVLDYLKLHYDFRKNLGNQRTEFRKITDNDFRELTDDDLNSVKVEVALQNIQCSRETLLTIICSGQWPSYNPYTEWLGSLPMWDGKDHIKQLADTVKTDDNNYFYWCLKKWLVALTGSLAEDDVVNQTAIIFCGPQGIGKSSWFRNILPNELKEYYGMGFLRPHDKETKIQLSELVLFCMDEVENMSVQNVESTKEILTEHLMYTRRAYTRLSKCYIRRCSFCGTANGVQILHDITGNRRFLCMNVKDIDLDFSNVNLPQVYAQAYQLFRTGFQFWFDRKEQTIVEAHNAKFRAVSIEDELITTYFEPCELNDKDAQLLQAHQILSKLLSKTSGIRLSVEKIGKVLSSKGFSRKKCHGIGKWVVKEKKEE